MCACRRYEPAKRTSALEGVAREMQLALAGRQAEAGAGAGAGATGPPYPQRAFAKDTGSVVRALGDALAWLGKRREAGQVFTAGFHQGLWQV